MLVAGRGGGAFLKLSVEASAFHASHGIPWCGRHTDGSSELTPFCPPVAGDRLSEKETEDLMAWMRNALGSRVTNVKVRPSGDRPPRPSGTSQLPAESLALWMPFWQPLRPRSEVEMGALLPSLGAHMLVPRGVRVPLCRAGGSREKRGSPASCPQGTVVAKDLGSLLSSSGS